MLPTLLASSCLEDAIPASERRNLVAWLGWSISQRDTGSWVEKKKIIDSKRALLVGDVLVSCKEGSGFLSGFFQRFAL